MRTLYEVLGISQHAECEQVRKAYKQALLQHHPDKKRASTTQAAPHQPDSLQPTSVPINEIRLAFDVLRDAALKAAYDASLKAGAQQDEVHPWETVPLSEMQAAGNGACSANPEFDSTTTPGTYLYDCRCGDVYRLTARDAAAHTQPATSQQHISAVLIGCATCGNVLEVTLS